MVLVFSQGFVERLREYFVQRLRVFLVKRLSVFFAGEVERFKKKIV